jgi:molecular chaperone GrpE
MTTRKGSGKPKTQAQTKTRVTKEDKLKKLVKENKALKEQLLRKLAEFDNYKKRTEREILQLIQNASETLIIVLLPVLDDMERFLQHVKEQKNKESIIEGSQLIFKKFIDVLEKEGLQPMKSVGEMFDPELHDALMQMEKKKVKSGTILNEYLKGYLLNGKVIRHAQVIVSK